MGGLGDRFSRCFKGWRTGQPQLPLQFAPVAFLEAVEPCGRSSSTGIHVAVQRFVALAHLLPLAHRKAVAITPGDELLGAQLLEELGVDLGQVDETGCHGSA